MKKLIKILTLILALSMVFCSCGKEEAEVKTDVEAKTDETDAVTEASSGEAQAAEGTFTPSLYHDDNGMWEGVTATDYVTMGEYKGLTITDVDPEESEILSEIDSLLESYATNVPVFDREIAAGDSVNIDYVGYVDGVAFEGGDTQGAGTEVTAGSSNYIDDFLTQIIGHMPGDEFDINVTFPEDYGKEELNGKDAVFKTTINYINDKVVPEYKDEDIAAFLAADFNVSTCDELYAFISDALRSSNISMAVEDAIMENLTVNDIPEKVMDYQKKTMEDYYTQYATYYGMDLNSFLASYLGASSMDDLVAMYEEDMKETSKLSLALQAIAETEGLSVSEDEAMTFIKEATGEDDVTTYVANYGINYFKMVTLQEKVINLVVENAVIE